jgi:hypothetical protein
MSYDLAVFELTAAPTGRKEFLEWYAQQTEWQESHGYDNPEVSSSALRSWFLEMIEQFPPMNGAYVKDDVDVDDPSITDYSVGRAIIYAAFAWSKAEEAFKATTRLAEKHRVGFYNLSSSRDEVYFPDPSGRLFLAF